MEQVLVRASRIYEVIIGEGVLSELGLRAAALLRGRRAVIVTDSNVGPLYARRTEETLRDAGFAVTTFTFPAGEASKNPGTLLELLTFFAKQELTREDVVIALGGGVTGDLAGLAASLYLRGVPCIQVPTSLLAMVDSSVGGKTAVDLPEGKNLVGTFTQPYLVLCDITTLDTLPKEVFEEGMAEVIKYGMIRSKELLELLLTEDAERKRERVIAQCVRLKRDVVAEDEQDFGERQILNFGHTLGHAIEREMNYKLFHGDCVAIGMAIMTRALVRDGRCPESCEKILEKLLKKYKLPNSTELPSERILAAARADKKRRGEKITLIEPKTLGNCVLVKTDFAELARLLELGR